MSTGHDIDDELLTVKDEDKNDEVLANYSGRRRSTNMMVLLGALIRWGMYQN